MALAAAEKYPHHQTPDNVDAFRVPPSEINRLREKAANGNELTPEEKEVLYLDDLHAKNVEKMVRISKKFAEAVARGEIGLEEAAVRLQRFRAALNVDAQHLPEGLDADVKAMLEQTSLVANQEVKSESTGILKQVYSLGERVISAIVNVVGSVVGFVWKNKLMTVVLAMLLGSAFFSGVGLLNAGLFDSAMATMSSAIEPFTGGADLAGGIANAEGVFPVM